ncbi:hypothetical protein HBH56_113250 [Parastagonospora nodorum]|uniref:XPG-I domain-containing protein n=1 Tax=Phaeosphaeria nodorum (strain SN15 / ATCC MYA-4574 / FGSC 10173) TaxID=321614 RepID=A0A7U2FI59_PHANO|nr:hypothetical protein HBH56_113250 [Parastagonospora nodorum]QRD03565.1 hypothetical protein JI435_103290 [Parastagonospora nodorum SN15]KAH3921526.1 hypothetical protein HBH54_239210 [Parastagonospora nodorum]KAH3979097.1 hypothetical protein HBH52_097310 [Parastagonospora nodorum]KAH3999388.1 hypothetical protein HBI10_116120 [Parastagonospora nodorum]
MGIPQLFDVIKDHEEVVPIAQLAEDHHRRYGRPLRIAIDEADWRFNNLTQAQVYAIRDTSDMAYQGQEKTMFYRICRFLTLNIQLIFVFDGPSRPWKNGKRGQGKIDYRERDLLKEVLRCFGIAFHEAPGEAEAECARLQILGLVDAVWSQDSDSIMFGCTLWIRDDRVVKEKGTTDRSKENTQKSKKTARVVRAENLKARLHLDREALVLFAMLVGGDYDRQGLPGCGPSIAKQVIRKGLGQSLCMCLNQRDCDAWSLLLVESLPRNIAVPHGFPSFKTLVKYNSPKVSADEVLQKNAKLNLDYLRPIDELKLLEVTSSRFNIWGRLYMNWVGPVLLMKCLSKGSSSVAPEVVNSIRMVKQKAGQTDRGPVFERKLSFSPFGVTTLRREDFEGDRFGYWNGDRTTLFDPEHRVEKCEMPNYWLQKALPPDVLDPPPAVPKSRSKKRRQQAEASSEPAETVGAIIKKARKAPRSNATGRQSSPTKTSAPPYVTPTRQSRPKRPIDRTEDVVEISDSDEELRLPPSRRLQKSLARSDVSRVVDLGSPSSSDEAADIIARRMSQKAAGLQRPDRVDHTRPVSPIGLHDIEDVRDFQFALRMSVRERNAAPSIPGERCLNSSSNPGMPTYNDSIPEQPFRVSRGERQSMSFNVHAEPLSGGNEDLTETLREHATFGAYNSPAARIEFLSTASRKQADTMHSSSHVSQKNSASLEPAIAHNAHLTSPTLDNIRAARLKHFQSSGAVTPTNDDQPGITQPNMTPRRPVPSAFFGLAGTDCIDLTDD